MKLTPALLFLRKTCFLFFLTLPVSGYSQSFADYLNTHKQNITNSITESNILDADFFNHSIFLLGESHGVQKPQEIDFNFVKLLNKKVGMHTYVGEFDFAKAYFLNQYLQTGNEKLLDTVFSDWVSGYAQWANTDFQQKIRNIRAYNKGLSANKQIHFAGIDQVHNNNLVADFYKEVLADKSLKALQPRFEDLISILRKPDSDSLVAVEAQKLMADLNSEKRNNYNQSLYSQVLYGLAICSAIRMKGREQALFNNFKYLYQHNNWKAEKLYGFWGFTHTLQAKVNGDKLVPFATLLINDADLNLKDKVASIACLYSGSKMMLPTPYLPPFWQDTTKRYTASPMFNNDAEMMNVKNLAAFKEASQPNTATLFKISGTNSPFATQKIDIQYSPFMPAQQRLTLDQEGKFMTDYFQYLILIRDSPATNAIWN